MRENAIHDAMFAELVKLGYAALTIGAVATRAKTGKASIYRRWDTKQNLVLDAFIARFGAPDDLLSSLLVDTDAPPAISFSHGSPGSSGSPRRPASPSAPSSVRPAATPISTRRSSSRFVVRSTPCLSTYCGAASTAAKSGPTRYPTSTPTSFPRYSPTGWSSTTNW
jgi:Bacterial regulatory proteins, tetR family